MAEEQVELETGCFHPHASSPGVRWHLQASLGQHPEASPGQHSELDRCLEEQSGKRLARFIASFIQPYTCCLLLGNLVELQEQGPGEVSFHTVPPQSPAKKKARTVGWTP